MGKLSDHVSIDSLAARSVNLERDSGDQDLAGYVPTARSIDTVDRVIDGLASPAGTRAWSITGPYGCGKSSFALFLDALVGPDSELHDSAIELLASAAPELAVRVRELAEPTNGLIRATTVAAIEPIAVSVGRALERGIRRRWGPKVPRRVQQALRNLAEHNDPVTIKACVEAAAAYAPVLLVIDEFGKNLEHHAAAAPGELFLLQELAELFSGTKGVRGGVLTLQHLAFEDYASTLTTTARREWAKVQGRFEDITFVDSPDQIVRLIADSIDHEPTSRAMATRLEKWTAVATAGAERHGLTTYLGSASIVGRCFPIHPAAAAALPELCSQYGQYERTLVSFLASGEPDSVVGFCAATTDGDPLRSVGIAEVFDYFVTAARTLTGAAAGSARWLEIEARINEALVDDEDLELLKIIGVLNLVSGNGPLRASPDIVAFAADITERRSAEVRRRLNNLCERGVLAFRSFADEYRLWNGTDFDVSGSITEARELLSTASPAQLLTDAAGHAPVIAGRHSQETGILRYFDVSFVDPGDEVPTRPSSADGLLVYVTGAGQLPVAPDEKRPVVFVRSDHVNEPLAAALELAAIRRVLRDRASDLANDWVARRELQERAAHAQVEVTLRVAAAFAPARKGVRWSCDGESASSAAFRPPESTEKADRIDRRQAPPREATGLLPQLSHLRPGPPSRAVHRCRRPSSSTQAHVSRLPREREPPDPASQGSVRGSWLSRPGEVRAPNRTRRTLRAPLVAEDRDENRVGGSVARPRTEAEGSPRGPRRAESRQGALMPQTLAFNAMSQTLLQLLQPGQGFYVPVYQRTYTWGADQIDRLFEDVNAGLNRAEQAPGPPTFLGSVILFEGRASVTPRVNTALPAQVLHVVDGQQRLTTLLLILGQLRSLA
ncbi:MAG: GmrSD restriction endonuclease domain-containing protein [Acidimicrobiia bacterium]